MTVRELVNTLPMLATGPARELASGTHAGFPWVVTHSGQGFRCGYVGVPFGHPWWFQVVENIDTEDGLDYSILGVSWVEPPTNPFWFVGFDYAHPEDLIDYSLPMHPGQVDFSRRIDEIYARTTTVKRLFRGTQEVAEARCKRLCEEAAIAQEIADHLKATGGV